MGLLQLQRREPQHEDRDRGDDVTKGGNGNTGLKRQEGPVVARIESASDIGMNRPSGPGGGLLRETPEGLAKPAQPASEHEVMMPPASDTMESLRCFGPLPPDRRSSSRCSGTFQLVD
jgi:hypothetical protein